MVRVITSTGFLILFSLILTTIPQQALGAKILSVSFISSKSHKITYEPLLYELAARGHSVTVMAPYISGKTMPNLREILTMDAEKIFDDNKQLPNMFDMRLKGEKMNPFNMVEFFGKLCAETYDLSHVKELLAKEKFDLIIMSGIFNECTAGYVYKFNTSVVLVSPVTAPTWLASIFGNPSPPSFVPNLFTKFDDSMNFYERTLNLITEIGIRIVNGYFFQPAMAKIYREKLNDPNIPLNDEILKNASLILSNSHFSLSKSRPFLPDIIEVGGMHCRPAKPLPKDLDDFLNSSGPDGFIYFSMGSALKGITMPESYRQIFLRTFAKLKQKVLWKWETEKMDDLPPNVKLSKWLPQQDVLGHPKIKAFVMHGGFGGTTEAVYHGVPLVGIPMLGDQELNMKKSVDAGFAISLEITTLTEEQLFDAITRVVTEPKYRENVQKLSKVFRDQPDKPLDRAVFWTEYIIKHKGAMHLRSPARDLNFFQYHSLDVIFTLVGVIVTVLYLIFAILRFIVRKTCCRGAGKSVSSKKKRN